MRSSKPKSDLTINYKNARWFKALVSGVNEFGVTGFAKKLERSPALISLVVSGKYPHSTAKLESAVLKYFASNPLAKGVPEKGGGSSRILRDYMSEDWFVRLESFSKEWGLKRASKDIGYSATAVSQLLNGKYPAKLEEVVEAVQNTITRTVRCPLYGNEEISVTQHRKFSLVPLRGGHERMDIYHSCSDCPNIEPDLPIMPTTDPDQVWLPLERRHALSKEDRAAQHSRLFFRSPYVAKEVRKKKMQELRDQLDLQSAFKPGTPKAFDAEVKS